MSDQSRGAAMTPAADRERAEQAEVHTQPEASVHELVLQLVKEVVVTAAERTFRNGGLDAAAFQRFAHDVTEVCDKKLEKP